jgi:hypothetical protein
MNKWIMDTPLIATVNGVTSGENFSLNVNKNQRISPVNRSGEKIRKSGSLVV